jgi:hypothetical protein
LEEIPGPRQEMEIKGRVGMDTPPGSTGRNKKEQEGTRRNKKEQGTQDGEDRTRSGDQRERAMDAY